jgi:signal transduction histidine kinase
VALVAGAFVALHLHRRLTVPIAALLNGIEHVREGNLDHRISLEGDEEFQALGNALNDAYRNLKTAQEGVLQAEKMAAVGKLAAGVAHEVSNPLASISSVVQMMRRKGQSPEQAERIDLIMQHIARVSRVVRELLTFSRPPDSGRQGRVDISALLDRAVSLLRYDKRAGQTEITCRYEPGLDMALGDADRLLLVFTNIMINTFDALSTHRNGHPRLTISARQNGDRIIIRFKDNGPGMSKEQIRDAFEPFFTTKDPGTGTGLGLWICYEVVRKHHGTIRIDSRVGKGTAVIIELPKDAPMVDSAADGAPTLEARRS